MLRDIDNNMQLISLNKEIKQVEAMDLLLLVHAKTESERCQAGILGHFLKWACFCGDQKALFPMKMNEPKMYTFIHAANIVFKRIYNIMFSETENVNDTLHWWLRLWITFLQFHFTQDKGNFQWEYHEKNTNFGN